MESFTKLYRKVMRHSTLILMGITIITGGYVWYTWPETYYQTFCEDPAGEVFSQKFDNAYDCDTAAIQQMTRENNQCLKVGCRFVQE